MTATNIVLQRDCLHVLTDGATYTADGTVLGLGAIKTFTIPSWPGVVTGRGSAIQIALLSQDLALNFETFDKLVEGVAVFLPQACQRFGFKDSAELILCGWSSARNAAEGYVIETSGDAPLGDCDTADGLVGDQFELVKLPAVVCGPVPTNEIIIAAEYQGIDVNASAEDVIKQLRLLIEIQRQSVFPGVGACFIGGNVQLTTIRPDRVEQRVIHTWEEDKTGQLIKPLRIDLNALAVTPT